MLINIYSIDGAGNDVMFNRENADNTLYSSGSTE